MGQSNIINYGEKCNLDQQGLGQGECHSSNALNQHMGGGAKCDLDLQGHG